MFSTIDGLVDGPPDIIFGGMGAGISNWRYVKEIGLTAKHTHARLLGVVSGTGMDTVLIRRLQMGDPGGHMQRGMEQFPFPLVAEKVFEDYFISGGKAQDKPFKRGEMFSVHPSKELLQLTVLANFVEVFLAKEGHDNEVGINYLEKIQMPHLPSIYGAMLAGVNKVLMGAGILNKIPGVLDLLSSHEAVSYGLTVDNEQEGLSAHMHFDPKEVFGSLTGELNRPDFIGVTSTNALASHLVKKGSGKVYGAVNENEAAGGHSLNSRTKDEFGNTMFDDEGEPIYGEKDIVDIVELAKLGPFWEAGNYSSPEKLREAKASGAAGVQMGTLGLLSDESGLDDVLKQELLKQLYYGELKVHTNLKSSPAGINFKELSLAGTNSEQAVCDARPKICDLGYLRTLFRKPNGEIGYRCPSEPDAAWIQKGGSQEAMEGKKDLCNGLMADIGLAQLQKNGYLELPLITAGKCINDIKPFIKKIQPVSSIDPVFRYSIADVIHYMAQGV